MSSQNTEYMEKYYFQKKVHGPFEEDTVMERIRTYSGHTPSHYKGAEVRV